MALDTAEKRKSISGIGLIIPGVTPNSSKDAEWRQQSAWSYSGIAIAAVVVIEIKPRAISEVGHRFSSEVGHKQISEEGGKFVTEI